LQVKKGEIRGGRSLGRILQRENVKKKGHDKCDAEELTEGSLQKKNRPKGMPKERNDTVFSKAVLWKKRNELLYSNLRKRNRFRIAGE